eukprot:10071809-Karenia_brevis.AAC.1
MGSPAVWCLNGMVTRLLSHPVAGIMKAGEVEKLQQDAKKWEIMGVMGCFPHFKVANMFKSEHKRLEVQHRV